MNEVIHVDDIDVDLKGMINEALTYKTESQQLVAIADDEGYKRVAQVLKAVKSRLTELEARRKEITRPLDNAKKSVMDLFSAPKEYFEAAEKVLKGLMVAYQEKLDAIRREEERKAREERIRLAEEAKAAQAKGLDFLSEEMSEKAKEVAPVEVPKAKAYGTSAVRKIKWRVIDFDAIPPEYLETIVNEALIAQHILNYGKYCFDHKPIPGIEFYEETTIRA